MSKSKKLLFLLFVLLIAFSTLLIHTVSGYYMEEEHHIEYVIDGVETIYQLPQTLKKEGIIRSSLLFRFLLHNSKIDKNISMGYYVFSNHDSTLGILLKLRNNQTEQIHITVLEGHDSYDVAQTLTREGIIASPSIFIQAVRSQKWKNYVEKTFHIKTSSIEGFIYPNTYQIPKGTSYELFLKLALKGFESHIYKDYQALSPSEFYKTLIIASLVEKETVISEERPLVSSVIHNRLRIGMKLQIDPTLIYTIKVTGKVQESLKDNKINIRREHFSIPSPFNTYYTSSIPPTPIASATVSSFKAALNPASTTYLYFVANPRIAKHTFTSTLVEHTKYVKLYTHERHLMRQGK